MLNDVSVQIRDQDDNQALHLAVKSGNLEAVKIILEECETRVARQIVKSRNAKGELPVDIARMNGHIEIYHFLQNL